jgi:hypothetical protein
MKKLNKQCSLLTEATVTQSILTILISSPEIDKEIVVFNGGAIDNPPSRPPDGVVWQRIPDSDGNQILLDGKGIPRTIAAVQLAIIL